MPGIAARVLWLWVRLAWQSRTLRRPRLDSLLVGYLGHFDVHLARLLFPRTPIVLDHLVSLAGVFVDRGLADHRSAVTRGLRRLDRAALERADVVLVDTEEHADDLPPECRQRAIVIPVGAASEWFKARRPDAATDPPHGLRVVFFGVFTPLHGTLTIAAAAAALAGEETVHLTMIGSGQDFADSRAVARGRNVTWTEWVDSDELPGVVAGHDVCLGIFGTTEKALKVVPNKVYQGAAAGCAIITSDTPPQRRALGDAALFVPPGDASALATALRDLAGDATRLAGLRAAARHQADSAFRSETLVSPLRARLDHLSSRGDQATPR